MEADPNHTGYRSDPLDAHIMENWVELGNTTIHRRTALRLKIRCCAGLHCPWTLTVEFRHFLLDTVRSFCLPLDFPRGRPLKHANTYVTGHWIDTLLHNYIRLYQLFYNKPGYFMLMNVHP